MRLAVDNRAARRRSLRGFVTEQQIGASEREIDPACKVCGHELIGSARVAAHRYNPSDEFVPRLAGRLQFAKDVFGNPPDLCEVIPICPLCDGRMELAYNRPTMKVCVCADCHLSITVPAHSWDMAIARGRITPKDF